MAGLDKVVSTYEEALEGLEDDMTLLAGGFGLCGIPENLIQGIVRKGTKGLTVYSNNCGVDDFGLGLLLHERQIKKMAGSYVGENKTFETQMMDGSLDVELIPQGTLAERMGKETREFDGKPYVMERGIVGDFALVKAWKADRFGNAIYRLSAQNFNPMVATAGKVTVMEVEEIVEPGELDPAQIHTPGIYVDRLIQGTFEKRIEQRTVREA